jgi:type IV pilus assembly protein PilC
MSQLSPPAPNPFIEPPGSNSRTTANVASTPLDHAPGSQLKAPKVKPKRMTRADKARLRAEEQILGVRKKSILQFELTTDKVKPAELMNFARQAASFIRAGIPVLDALDVLVEDMTNPKFRAILIDVGRKLRGGRAFADALSDHDKVFPKYFVSMIRSAEMTGRLDQTFDQLAVYIERDLEARRKVKSALTYPIVVVCMAFASVVTLAAYVLPKFKVFFKSLNAKLPLPTRMLLAVTDLFANYWLIMFATFGVVVAASILAMRKEAVKYKRDAFMLKIPAVGIVMRYALIERFCRILSSLVQSGVSLPDAMAVATGTTANRVYQKALGEVNRAMLRGEGLATPMAETELFPGGAIQMLRVGESTGTLDQQLESAGQFYERELNYRLKRLTDLVEPAVILCVGFIVGFVAIALVSAMYGVFNQVQS